MPKSNTKPLVPTTLSQQLDVAQRLGLKCSSCGSPIQAYCCGKKLPLSVEDFLRVHMSYGKLWQDDHASQLSTEMVFNLQAVLNQMYLDGIRKININADGLVEVLR